MGCKTRRCFGYSDGETAAILRTFRAFRVSLEQSDGVSSERSDDQRSRRTSPSSALQAWAIGLDGSYKLAKAERISESRWRKSHLNCGNNAGFSSAVALFRLERRTFN